MEYDDERSGGLEPLKYLPKGNKRVMPGFITTKQGKLETLDFLKKKFEEASKKSHQGSKSEKYSTALLWGTCSKNHYNVKDMR